MADKIKPLKRSKELAPLSHLHHDGLLFIWKIRQGLANGTSQELLRKYVLWYWQERIKPHFFQEEQILIPYMSKGDPAIVRLKDEHEQIRELILSLDEEADKQTFIILCDLVDKHIRWEERELFSSLERGLNQDQLTTIFKKLEEHPVSSEKWTDEFWTKK